MADFELKHPGGQLPLPVTGATEGPSGLEVSHLLKDTGYVFRHPDLSPALNALLR